MCGVVLREAQALDGKEILFWAIDRVLPIDPPGSVLMDSMTANRSTAVLQA